MTTTEAPTKAADVMQHGRAPLPAVPERNAMHVGKPAYAAYSEEMIKLIQASIMPAEATQADLYYLLEMSATYKLDPFAKEIWAVKMPGKNAGKSGVVIMVGRDGLLAIAERNKDYRGFRCKAIHENDVYEYDDTPRKMPDGTYTHVRHKHGKKSDRGALVGAWAEVYRNRRPTVFFEADLSEYIKGGEYSPWQKQVTVMIQKCALATALRHAYRISGLYLADEFSNAPLEKLTEADQEQPPVTVGLNLGDDPLMAAWLAALLTALEREKPDEYLPGKQRLLLAPLDDVGRAELAAKLQQELYETTGELIEMPTASAPEEEPEAVSAEDTELVD